MTLNLEILIHLECDNVLISDRLRFAVFSPCIASPVLLDPNGIIIALLFDIFGILKFKELACNVLHMRSDQKTHERFCIIEVQRTHAQDKRERRFHSNFHFGERVVKDPRKTCQGTLSHNITERISHFENHEPYGTVKGGKKTVRKKVAKGELVRTFF